MPPRLPQSFSDQCVALAWGAWVELGVSGWGATHGKWAVDPEPLIVFTAWLGDRDPRLRDEATDWCIRYASRVSKARLRNLARAQPDHVREAFGQLSATVSEHAGVSWPDATEARRYRVTGKSTLPPLDRPSLAWLRLRAILGLGARTEILRFFLVHQGASASVARLARWTGYTKRNVAEECEALEAAGELRSRTIGNRYSYSLAKGALVEGFGGMPPICPNWTAVCNVGRELAELESTTEHSSPKTVPMKVKRALANIEDDIDEVEAEPPRQDARGPDLWPEVEALDRRTLRRWSVGNWTMT